MTRPITPAEVISKKQASIPPFVFDAFNEMIAKNWDGRESFVLQRDVVTLIKSKIVDAQLFLAFDTTWLNVEDVYRKAGWIVKYDKPAYNETYSANFTFSKPRP